MSPEVLGAIIAGLTTIVAAGIALLVHRRSQREQFPASTIAGSKHAIRIASPNDGALVTTRVEVTGTYEMLPGGTHLYLVTTKPSSGLHWPQAADPVKTNPSKRTWRGSAWIESDIQIQVVSAGACAEILFAYYERAGKLSNTWHGIERLPPDVLIHDSIWVRHKG